ncbi:MAG: hypothetical protein JWQ78_146 [Sediminibacterium sp.]|nr:hypothetical protein [Sediminibacterium sp.]
MTGHAYKPGLLRKIAAIMYCLVAWQSAGSQSIGMDHYTNQLFFNIFQPAPDTAIKGFIKAHLPSLVDKKDPVAAWTNYTAVDTFHSHREIHCFVFNRHPYFREKFPEGRLEVECKRYEDAKLLQNITNVALVFEFESQMEAEIAFSRLVDMFILCATDKKFSTVNGSQKAEFTNTKETKGFNRIQFRLTTDTISRYRYRIVFQTGNSI